MQTLDDTRTHDPDLGGGSCLFTKVETEEEETAGGRNGVAVRRNAGDGLSGAGEHAAEGRESDKQERDREPGRQRELIGLRATYMSHGRERT